MENKQIVKVTNRDSGYVGYQIPEHGIYRNFMPGESKNISLEELQWLQWTDGGEYMLKHLLLINDKNALESLNMENVEPEYFYTKDKIKDILFNGSLDQLEDTLNFGPEGVLELIKDIAVTDEIPDIRKRKMISEKTGLDINSAINIKNMYKDGDAEEDVPEAPKRKISVTTDLPVRKIKVTTPNT